MKFPTFGRVMAVDSKLRFLEFFTIIMKFWNWNDRIPSHHALLWKYGAWAGLGSKPQALVAMDSELMTILALRPVK
jgi:hypothetical protein